MKYWKNEAHPGYAPDIIPVEQNNISEPRKILFIMRLVEDKKNIKKAWNSCMKKLHRIDNL